MEYGNLWKKGKGKGWKWEENHLTLDLVLVLVHVHVLLLLLLRRPLYFTCSHILFSINSTQLNLTSALLPRTKAVPNQTNTLLHSFQFKFLFSCYRNVRKWKKKRERRKSWSSDWPCTILFSKFLQITQTRLNFSTCLTETCHARKITWSQSFYHVSNYHNLFFLICYGLVTHTNGSVGLWQLV